MNLFYPIKEAVKKPWVYKPLLVVTAVADLATFALGCKGNDPIDNPPIDDIDNPPVITEHYVETIDGAVDSILTSTPFRIVAEGYDDNGIASGNSKVSGSGERELHEQDGSWVSGEYGNIKRPGIYNYSVTFRDINGQLTTMEGSFEVYDTEADININNIVKPDSVKSNQEFQLSIPVNDVTDYDVMSGVYFSLQKKNGASTPITVPSNEKDGIYTGTATIKNPGNYDVILVSSDANNETTHFNIGTIVCEGGEPEHTFENIILEELQNYHGVSPQEIYSPAVLDNMLNYAKDNESLISDYDSRNFYILTELIKDNPTAVNHAVALDQYVREIDDMIFDYCRIYSLDAKIKGYNGVPFENDVFVRDLINLNWSNFLPFMESGEAKEGEFTLLPKAIFYNDGIERKRSNEIYPAGYGVSPFPIEVAYENIKNFQQIRDKSIEVSEHPDYLKVVSGGHFTTKDVLLAWVDGSVPSMSENSSPQAHKDIEALFDNGSENTRRWLKLYSFNTTSWGEHSLSDEPRVELTIIDLWARPELNLRPYRISPSNLPHGLLACDIEESDLRLLESICDEEYLKLPSPYGTDSINTSIIFTRKERTKKDGIEIIQHSIDGRGYQILIKLE